MSLTQTLTPEQKKYHDRLNEDFRFYARHALKIRTKEGPITPFIFNDAQDIIDRALNKQLQERGKIRALILKGRQQGCSTYVDGRFYWRTSHRYGVSAFILSHQSDTTEKLFQKIELFHQLIPDPLKPKTEVANRRRLVFGGLNSEFFVGTAGNDDVGRGGTVQFLHASEAAYYPNPKGFSTGLLQSVPDAAGTEVIIESTANGMDPYFYPACMAALRGEGEYELIFVPWFIQKEYTKEPNDDFKMTQQESELAELHKLTPGQIYWRRMKILDLKSESLFKQEYPCTVEEAFIMSGAALIRSDAIMAARKKVVKDAQAPKILGVDPGRNTDRSVLVDRQGRQMRWYRKYEAHETGGGDSQWEMRLAGIIANLINVEMYDKVFIDCTKGYGTHDRLCELGYGKIVIAVVFSEGAIESSVYLNKRAEMFGNLRDWFHDEQVSCPDNDEFHKDLAVIPDFKETSSGLLKLEPKAKIKEDFGFSPDIADAAALTFAYPVRRTNLEQQYFGTSTGGNKKAGLTTMKRRRELTQKNSNSLTVGMWR